MSRIFRVKDLETTLVRTVHSLIVLNERFNGIAFIRSTVLWLDFLILDYCVKLNLIIWLISKIFSNLTNKSEMEQLTSLMSSIKDKDDYCVMTGHSNISIKWKWTRKYSCLRLSNLRILMDINKFNYMYFVYTLSISKLF